MSAFRDFLVEIGTEELPPKSLLVLSQAFADGVAIGLSDASLQHRAVERFATPRRLAVRVADHNPQVPPGLKVHPSDVSVGEQHPGVEATIPGPQAAGRHAAGGVGGQVGERAAGRVAGAGETGRRLRSSGTPTAR